MIQIFAGRKGSGKTKRLIDLTNKTAHEEKGDVIFIDEDNRYMFDVDHKVRFINVSEYHVNGTDMFKGFISGILSSNFDVKTVFIDAFVKLSNEKTDKKLEDTKTEEEKKAERTEKLKNASSVVSVLEELSKTHNVDFVLSVSADPSEISGIMSQYIR